MACVFGVKRSHQYLYGRKFELHTDRKPPLTVFDPYRGTPTQVSAHIQKWAVTMAAYQYSIRYKKGALHSNADGSSTSWLTVHQTVNLSTSAEVALLVEALQEMPTTHTQISMWTRRDPVLALVSRFIFQGWPLQVSEDEDIKP